MKLDLTKAQYKELLKLVMLGTEVKMTALEAMGEPHEGVDALETYLLEHVEDFELDELVRKTGDETLPSEKLVHEIDHLMYHYDDDSLRWRQSSDSEIFTSRFHLTSAAL